ncbi:MAG: hypothetical protein L3J93_04065 [Thermoplasmata archaeon]|nr:hypothetical protein [Thermoplasmata archaeon]
MPRKAPPPGNGLVSLRGGTSLAELLFLYDCVTETPTKLRPIAERIGVTVQAVSHSYGRLARRGFVRIEAGRYRATVEGIAWLHGMLRGLAEDVFLRQERLAIIRSCRAIALADLDEGERVTLELVDGLLSARPGSSDGSRGRAARRTRAGSLVEVADLEGILPLPKASVRVVVVPVSRLGDRSLRSELARIVRARPEGLLAAPALEAAHLLRTAVSRPFARFAVAESVADAARVGVSSTVVLLDQDLQRFLAEFPSPGPPPMEIQTLRAPGPAGRWNRRSLR